MLWHFVWLIFNTNLKKTHRVRRNLQLAAVRLVKRQHKHNHGNKKQLIFFTSVQAWINKSLRSRIGPTTTFLSWAQKNNWGMSKWFIIQNSEPLGWLRCGRTARDWAPKKFSFFLPSLSHHQPKQTPGKEKEGNVAERGTQTETETNELSATSRIDLL